MGSRPARRGACVAARFLLAVRSTNGIDRRRDEQAAERLDAGTMGRSLRRALERLWTSASARWGAFSARVTRRAGDPRARNSCAAFRTRERTAKPREYSGRFLARARAGHGPTPHVRRARASGREPHGIHQSKTDWPVSEVS